MVMPYTHWVCLSVFIEIYNLLRGMLNKFMTRLYHTKTILYIIIIRLEDQLHPTLSYHFIDIVVAIMIVTIIIIVVIVVVVVVISI